MYLDYFFGSIIPEQYLSIGSLRDEMPGFLQHTEMDNGTLVGVEHT